MRVGVLLLIAGCGRFGFDPLVTTGDDASQSSDAPLDAPCTWSAFSTPVQLPGVVQSPSDDWSPGPSLGGSVVYFHSARLGGNAVIFRAQLLPTPLAAVHVNELDLGSSYLANPSLTDDGLEIYFDSDVMVTERKIYSATRTSDAQPFSTPTLVASINMAGFDEQDPSITGDGLRMIFSSSRTGLTELFEASRPNRTSPFGPAVRLSELESASNTGRLDRGGTLAPNYLDVFFAAPPGGAGQDIFTAHRTSVGQPFGTPVRVSQLSSTQEDEYPKMSRDASTLWFTYQGVNSGGNAQLWTATRTCQ